MNVALHLATLGHPVKIISKIGDDHWGREIRQFLSERELSTALLQTDPELPTSEVLVSLDEQQNATFEIPAPVAWDRLEYTNAAEAYAADSSIIVYGTLGSRDPVSKSTILKLLETPPLKFMDVNLRPPYTPDPLVRELLGHARMAKLNDEELETIAGWINRQSEDETDMMKWVADHYELERLVVTRGARGALLLAEGTVVSHDGYPVKVADTVGAGDAFLAGFISSMIEESTAAESLDFACATGALVASRPGASPAYGLDEIHAIQKGRN